ncbi:MAG: hypothetical protein Q8M27_02170 [Methylotenera sp.]|nr:hypothetical protein [Methylotenera sp.]
MSMFKKPVDYRTDSKQVKKSDLLGKAVKNGLREENGKVTEVFTWKFIFAIALLPLWLLWKLLDFIHLLIFVIFGGLLLYFGASGLMKNAWTETALYFVIGAILVVAPVLYWLDKK